MSEPIANRIRRLLSLFDRGVITRLELTNQIADLAVDPDFFQNIDVLPPDIVLQLCEIAEHAPAHPEDCLIIGSFSVGLNSDHEEYERELRIVAYWSALRLREYFYPNLPLPKFEPLKLAGVVEEAIVWDGAVAVLGDIQTYWIRKNPIQLILPNGGTINASASRMIVIRGQSVLDTTEPSVDHIAGRHAVCLDQSVKSPSDIPSGTEVWVDRSNVSAPTLQESVAHK